MVQRFFSFCLTEVFMTDMIPLGFVGKDDKLRSDSQGERKNTQASLRPLPGHPLASAVPWTSRVRNTEGGAVSGQTHPITRQTLTFSWNPKTTKELLDLPVKIFYNLSHIYISLSYSLFSLSLGYPR